MSSSKMVAKVNPAMLQPAINLSLIDQYVNSVRSDLRLDSVEMDDEFIWDIFTDQAYDRLSNTAVRRVLRVAHLYLSIDATRVAGLDEGVPQAINASCDSRRPEPYLLVIVHPNAFRNIHEFAFTRSGPDSLAMLVGQSSYFKANNPQVVVEADDSVEINQCIFTTQLAVK